MATDPGEKAQRGRRRRPADAATTVTARRASPRSPGGDGPPDTLALDSDLQKRGGIGFCCGKPPHLLSLVWQSWEATTITHRNNKCFREASASEVRT